VLMCWTIGGATPAGRVISYPDHTEPDKRVIYVTQLSIKPVAGERGIRQDRTMVLPLLFSWNCSLIRCGRALVNHKRRSWRYIPCTKQIMLPYLSVPPWPYKIYSRCLFFLCVW
jgi:hypothetical protein